MKKYMSENKYNFYPEQVTSVMATAGLIYDDEVSEMESYIRGCA